MDEKILYGLNGSTTQPLEQREEVRRAAQAGFDLLEFRAPKIEQFLATGTLAELKLLLEQNAIRPLSINSLEQTDTRPPKDVQAECERYAGWARELGCPYLVAVPGFQDSPPTEKEVTKNAARAAAALAPLAEICGTRGIKLGFEFLGFADCTVNSLRAARNIVKKVNSPHLGLVIDTCHFYLSNQPVEALEELEPGELLLLHVNDVEDLPRAELRDPHRLLPGRGIIPLSDIWKILRERGLINHASLELFRPEYWELNPEKFLPEALASLRRVFR